MNDRWLFSLATLLVLFCALALMGCNQEAPAPPAPPAAAATPPASPSESAAPAPSGASAPTPAPAAAAVPQGENPVVVVDTSMGKIKIELFADKAPITVKNFLDYVHAKFYDGTIFHRVIPTFMIQGGGFEPGLVEKPTKAPIHNESDNGLSNTVGTVAMARTNVPDSATAQFFINVKDNLFLDRAQAQDGVGYCVFGKVIDGMDVVNKIRQVPTSEQGGMGDVPTDQAGVMIKSIRLVPAAAPAPAASQP